MLNQEEQGRDDGAFDVVGGQTPRRRAGICEQSMDGSPEREHALLHGAEPQHSVHHPLVHAVPAHDMDHVAAFEQWDDEKLRQFAKRFTTDSSARKGVPLASGLLDYFPDALFDVARLSQIGNDKHNPGQPLHWSRNKSNDHRDTIMRHLAESGVIDTDKVLHDTKVAWRALAQLQLSIERLRSRGVQYP
jgi:hypothetical protein